MRYTRTLVGVVAVGLLTVGCGGDDSDGADAKSTPSTSAEAPADSGDKNDKDDKGGENGGDAGSGAEGDELPVKVEEEGDLLGASPKIEPSPGRTATVTEKVLHELRQRTLRMAGVDGKTSGECAGGELKMEAGATTKCTVDYEGVKVPWDVTISDNYKPGSFVFSYRATPQKAVLTAKSAYGNFYKLNNSTSDQLRCSEIPDAVLVDLGEDTEYRCQYLIKSQNRWSDRAVAVREMGVTFNLVR
ncbi:hypothetical protein [Streptomyces alkaliterrae]|uniref:DUF4333 domain-containing protein n=1 Tax=Streptomyces alkaliterrae TaxID=2213162 RepID=A0A5P0YT54_9ACTN|nr:hypothetical protein [Streptomyces alkaliterrae]MBB1255937.1 hypothetical protein [Streptomyces alkaliterrae]MBB1259828.1 hypothetical protein [Streptomyces alkaliterrae]MQS03494.1 hypothetical protein [Streptomyces alkaliterrae]